jgi:hypothetical protein
VVHAVHVRRDDKPAQHSVRPGGQSDVAVVEHRRSVEQHLEDHHRQHRRPEHGDVGELDQFRIIDKRSQLWT